MPPPSNLPAEAITVRFPPAVVEERESYQLLELPSEILKAVEAGEVVPLTIKGRPHDDAVLCTADRTYALRTVAISNSLMILRPPNSTPDTPTLQIRDVCHEVLECTPAPARTERLRGVLADSAWRGLGSSNDDNDNQVTPTRHGKRKRADSRGKKYTLSQLQSIIQASDAELDAAIREVNAVEVDGYMTLLPPAPLADLLGVLLKLVTVHSSGGGGSSLDETLPSDEPYTPPECPAAEMFAALADHEVDAHLTSAVMRLFGSVDDEVWAADVRAMVVELGRALLVGIKDTPTPIDTFLATWREAAGHDWRSHVLLSSLEGYYILDDPPPTAFAAPCQILRYFPYHTLPSHVALRFTDLFLTRGRWRPDDMIPFLRGLYTPGDTKARDKLVVKFIRVVKEKDGAWWYPRRTG